MITKTHKRNLKKLQEYLLNGIREGTEFDMSEFAEIGADDHVTECGSVGCAVGHGPYAGIPKKEEEGWWGYSARVFGTIDREAPSPDRSDAYAWFWLFDACWAKTYGTPVDVADRIDALLEYGSVEVLVENYESLPVRTRCMVDDAKARYSKYDFPEGESDERRYIGTL